MRYALARGVIAIGNGIVEVGRLTAQAGRAIHPLPPWSVIEVASGARLDFVGLLWGVERETDEQYRQRCLDKMRQPPGGGTRG